MEDLISTPNKLVRGFFFATFGEYISHKLHWEFVDKKCISKIYYFYFKNKPTFLLMIMHPKVILVINIKEVLKMNMS
jgi:hypothetical protein